MLDQRLNAFPRRGRLRNEGNPLYVCCWPVATSSEQLTVRMLASRDHQVMLLVMHPPSHDTNETEGLELSGITLRDADFECRATLDVGRSELPSCVAVHRGSMCRDHALNRADYGAGSGNDVSDTAVERFGLDLRGQRDVAHIDQMPA